ncbi:hypothetical protein ACIRRX_32535, partial [Streptomyces bacillaris]
MTRKAGGGRPWGPIRAENPAAHKLAETLRRHVNDSGKTLAVLGGEINMRKSQTGNYLAGKVPTEAFIIALIQATVRPELRQRRQEEALFLREQAMRPVPRSASGSPAVPAVAVDPEYAVKLAAAQAQQIETYNRLARALEQWAEVEQAKSNSDKLIMVLLNMIHQLGRRVAGLVEERDQLRSRPRSEALEDAERKLARAEEQEQRARAELRRAEEKQRQAEDLEARVTDELRRLTDELDRLRAGDTASPLDALPGSAEGDYGLGGRRSSADPVGDDIDAALARASAVNDEENTALNRLSSELDEPVAGVVPDNPDPQHTTVIAAESVPAAAPASTPGTPTARHSPRVAPKPAQPTPPSLRAPSPKAPPESHPVGPAVQHALRALRSGQLTWEQRREQFRPGSVWHTAARILAESVPAAAPASTPGTPTARHSPRVAPKPAQPT